MYYYDDCDDKILKKLKNNEYSNNFFFEYLFKDTSYYQRNSHYPKLKKVYEYLINWKKEYNDNFDIIMAFLSKKYNICNDISQLIREYYCKYELNIKTLDSSIIENIKLTKKILSLNKTNDINVYVKKETKRKKDFSSKIEYLIWLLRRDETIPLLYYLIYKKNSNNLLEYFLKIGCNPNIKYKPQNKIYGKLIEYESLLEYIYCNCFDLNTVKLIEKYGGRMSEKAQIHYCGKIIYPK